MTRTASSNSRAQDRAANNAQAGFTLLEAVVAISILTVGLLGVAAAISYSVTTTSRTRNVTQAKQIILSTLEQITILRDAGRLTFEQIGNGAEGNFSGFVSTLQQVTNNAGPDGIHGTQDDIMTDDDTTNDGFRRSITVTELNPNLKKIEVTVEYPTGRLFNTLSGVGYINNDARSNMRR